MDEQRATHKLDPQKRAALLEMLDQLVAETAEKIRRPTSPDGIVTGDELLLRANDARGDKK